jgi:multiple sugar transport system substrate-binding protein
MEEQHRTVLWRGRRRREILAGLSALASTGILAGCGTGGSTVGGAGANGGNGAGVGGLGPKPTALRTGVKVSVLNDVNQATVPAFEQLLSEWKSAHPGTDVDWIRPQGAVSLAAMITAGTPPDLFSLGQDDAVSYAGRGEELALDDYAKRDRFDVAAFFPASVEMGKLNGKQFGFPRAFNCGIVYTNVSAFDQAGVPQPPLQWGAQKWGWAEFQDAAKRLSVPADDPKQVKFGADLLGGMGFFWSFVWANGGELFNADMTATRLNEPAAVQAVQFLADLIHRYQANPKPDVKAALGDRNIFNNGQAMMQYIGASNLNLYTPISQFTWDWRPIPSGRAGAPDWGGGNVWAISPKTQLREEAWSLFQHLVSDDAQAALAQNFFPARKKAVQAFLDAEAKAGHPPKNRQVIVDAMQNARVRPGHPRYVDVQKVLDEELAPVWQQGAAVQSALDAIKRRVDPILQGQ